MPRQLAPEKTVVVGVMPKGAPRATAEDHLDELERLVETAGGRVAARFLKERSAPDPATYVGKGAVEEIGAAVRDKDVHLVVFDDELSPGQVRNLETAWGDGVRVLDRPGLILDVFALHARSREARTQVELAQLQYLLPRLAGRYTHLSRLGGGIGGRGAGEQKLELDRRKIRDRIARLRRDLERIEVARLVRRRGRRRWMQVSIAGYTNAGKTTLFNRLARDTAYAADRLFATLDARAGRAASPKLANVIFVDTVGLVRKLPTSLVASFRSTLAEIRDADLILHVIDVSSPRADEEARIASETFEELGVAPSRVLTVWNKADVAGRAAAPGMRVSGTTGEGIERLEAEIAQRLRGGSEQFTVRIPYASGKAIAAARAAFRVLGEEDRGDAVELRLEGDRRHLKPIRAYVSDL
ncbi:MAG TPA: GTPase HflX [Thermoanaerobaculia bacterium]|nr:GTPase HflX [Thermoanaerobaculia bacterium]